MTPRQALDIIETAFRLDGWTTQRRQAYAQAEKWMVIAVNHTQATAPPPAGTNPVFKHRADVDRETERRRVMTQAARRRDHATDIFRRTADV